MVVHLFHIFESDRGVWHPRMLFEENMNCLSFKMIADTVVGKYEVIKRSEWVVWLFAVGNLAQTSHHVQHLRTSGVTLNMDQGILQQKPTEVKERHLV